MTDGIIFRLYFCGGMIIMTFFIVLIAIVLHKVKVKLKAFKTRQKTHSIKGDERFLDFEPLANLESGA